MRILILDDEPLIVEGLKACLTEHEIVTAYTGNDAIRLARAFLPELMLIDVNLPDINGIDVVKTLEEERVCTTIFLTAYSDKAILEKAKSLKGVHGYLVKPIDAHTLITTIEISMSKFKEFEKANSQLREAKKSLQDRKIIERAKGILMENMGLSEPKAMKSLQDQSKNANRKLVDTAKWVIEFFSGPENRKSV